MTVSAEQSRWFEKLVKQFRSLPGVEEDTDQNAGMILKITYNGKRRKIYLSQSVSEIRDQKNQYYQIRQTLNDLGILEGQKYVPPKRSRNPMTPQMVAARAVQQKEFEAWQNVWATIRLAEMSLDREYELAIMKDYY